MKIYKGLKYHECCENFRFRLNWSTHQNILNFYLAYEDSTVNCVISSLKDGGNTNTNSTGKISICTSMSIQFDLRIQERINNNYRKTKKTYNRLILWSVRNFTAKITRHLFCWHKHELFVIQIKESHQVSCLVSKTSDSWRNVKGCHYILRNYKHLKHTDTQLNNLIVPKQSFTGITATFVCRCQCFETFSLDVTLFASTVKVFQFRLTFEKKCDYIITNWCLFGSNWSLTSVSLNEQT